MQQTFSKYFHTLSCLGLSTAILAAASNQAPAQSFMNPYGSPNPEKSCSQHQALHALREYIQGRTLGNGKVVRDVLYETKHRIPPKSDDTGRCSQYWNEYVEVRSDYVDAYIANSSSYKSLEADQTLARGKYKSCFDAQVKYARDRIDNSGIHPGLDDALYALSVRGYESFKSAYKSTKGAC